jgi:hypothetical protein
MPGSPDHLAGHENSGLLQRFKVCSAMQVLTGHNLIVGIQVVQAIVCHVLVSQYLQWDAGTIL